MRPAPETLPKRYVAYYRCSTNEQLVSGLGIEAQKEAVARYIGDRGILVAEFTEQESGRKNDRQQLEAAKLECKRRKAVLIVSRLDRLSRSVLKIAQLLDAGFPFVCVDTPEASPE